MGLDSLTVVELSDLLQDSLGTSFPATLIFEYSTVEALANYLAKEVLSPQPSANYDIGLVSDGNLDSALNTLKKLFPILLIASLTSLATIAAIDYFWQRHQHIESLKMTRQEQKDEFKQTEGSPEVKQKIRQKQIEASMASAEQRKSVENVSNATAIITNPTHFAVALRYIVGEPGAPEVVAMGRGNVA